ncbi:MAG: T9SS type A sorting domain-containing protein [Bacteroidota bacterium]|nr:T9SS type A sorting domain-containing protein [Bacteroidota bacterium]MDP4231510.1 T9SS type A sorting domain-containing protein [Bacteroidota bacterium]MDP4236954.1 T9SS type A sorting domain-containing protein [Bacteroidota bacterium]
MIQRILLRVAFCLPVIQLIFVCSSSSSYAAVTDSVMWTRASAEETVVCEDSDIVRIYLFYNYSASSPLTRHVERVYLSGPDSAEWYGRSNQLGLLPLQNFDLHQGDSIFVDLVFKPTLNKPPLLMFADRSVQLIAKITDESDQTVELTGHVLHAAALVSPDSVDLGDVPLGVVVSRAFLVCDTGTAGLILDSIYPIKPPLISVSGIQPDDTVHPGQANCVLVNVTLELSTIQDTSFKLHLAFRTDCAGSKDVVFHIRSLNSDVEPATIPMTFSLFPNPVTGESVFINANREAVGEMAEIRICDLLGREVYFSRREMSADAMKIETPIGNVPNGIYYARIAVDGKIVTEKFEVLR